MVIGLLLAAGLSSRMGQEKLLLPFKGHTLLEETLENLSRAGLNHRVVVTKAAIAAALDFPEDVTVILNPRPEDGQASSLSLGIKTCRQIPDCEGILLFLGDEPLITPELIKRVLKAHRDNPQSIILPEYDGKPGHPVAIGPAWYKAFSGETGDRGGRQIIAAHPESVIRIPGDAPSVMDVDCEEDYRKVLHYGKKRNKS